MMSGGFMSALLLAALVTANVATRIDSVIVYTDQAMVVRTGTAALTGSGQLSFPDLPGILDDNSVRIKAPGLLIGEVQVNAGYIAEPTGRVKVLVDSLKKLNQQDQALEDEQEVVKAKETFLNSIKVGGPELISRELTAGRVDAGGWSSALGFLVSGLTEVKKRAAELKVLRADLEKVRTALQAELADARAKVENRKTIVAEVTAETPGMHDILLYYRVPYSVSWEPYYELRATPDEKNVELDYYVRMEQSTNEDWDNVNIVISTAHPAAGGVAPEPVPWYLNLQEPMTDQLLRQNEYWQTNRGWANAEEQNATIQAGAVNLAAQTARPPVRPVEAGISLQYALPGRISLKSGDDAKKFFLNSEKMAAEYSYYTYPRILPSAYLRARVQNSSDFVFMAGKANTYVGDEFTGKTSLTSLAPGESANPSFGIDDRMKIKHERVRSFTGKAGLFGNRTRAEFEFKTTIENYHTQTVTITVVEQIPLSQNRDITVSLTKLEPRGSVENKDNGTYTYKLELKPQQKVQIALGYAVEYPTEKRIVGLYRASDADGARPMEMNKQMRMMKK
jgi:uncharacterized protein (TIGR02231 family)